MDMASTNEKLKKIIWSPDRKYKWGRLRITLRRTNEAELKAILALTWRKSKKMAQESKIYENFVDASCTT